MHPYATDSNERVRVIAMLGVLSMLAGEATAQLLTTRPALPDWTVWFIDLSAVGWFGVFFWITNHYLWRLGLFHWPWLFQLPDLNGKWTGKLHTSHDEFGQPMECELEVQQTWTRICVKFKTHRNGARSSNSVSKAASLLLDQDGDTVLRYEYHNTPNPTQKTVLDIHWGTTKVIVSEELAIPVLEGSYYTNRNPPTHGTFRLKRL